MAPRLPCRASRVAAIVGVVTLLAACQPLPHPFADDVPPPGSPILTLRDNASVTIAPVDGTPRATPAAARRPQRDAAAVDMLPAA